MHWVLDVDFSEDECQVESENAQKTLNVFRKLAILAHRNYLKQNILKCLINEDILRSVLKNL
ncbi:hypothetical protein RyT2_01050 [Pseudolactococcus yaeyamensis]